MEFDLSKSSKPFQQERFGTMVVDSAMSQNRPITTIAATGSIGVQPVANCATTYTGSAAGTLTTGTGAALAAAFPTGSAVGAVCGPWILVNSSAYTATLAAGDGNVTLTTSSASPAVLTLTSRVFYTVLTGASTVTIIG